ncbi:uncharacterized protein LOC132785239 [Drosophila nasuta]|uniref:uncharacterized protein LOC132785239 n=1 Tax=Drosophila nasuta TaxID=42062 RepID=UPI00295ECAD3|nr:uncharacterized protein LOC132785239 [Drosophila nasuta]
MLDFYYMLYSAPCRSILMTAKALGIELNKKQVDLDAGDHLKPEFVKINPQHTIPTLVDGEFALWESRAILLYLVEKFDKDNLLYPKDLQQRAVVNHRLFFDLGTLYQSYVYYYYPQMFEAVKKPADPDNLKRIDAAFRSFNTLLEGHKYAAGDKLTVADIALLATVSTFEISDYDFSAHANVTSWYENAKKEIPGWEENWEGCLNYKKLYLSQLENKSTAAAMDFYYRPGSSPCRAVIMTAKAIGVEFDKSIVINTRAGEQFKPEYLKINPQHTIPTLVDNKEGLSLWESRAILVYLVEKYAKNDALYPKDVNKQALINQRLYFDMGTLYKSFADYYYPQIFQKQPANEEIFKKIEAAFDLFNTFLQDQSFAAGESLSVADISLLATVSSFDVAGFDLKRYSNVSKWYEQCKLITPGWDVNWAGCLEFRKYFDN